MKLLIILKKKLKTVTSVVKLRVLNIRSQPRSDLKRKYMKTMEIYEDYGYDFEFLRLRSIQINIEPTKESIGSYIDLSPDHKNS